jgi:hypothetical protein
MVQCVKCEPKIVEHVCYEHLSFNFVIHLKNIHGSDAAEEYENHLRLIGSTNKIIETSVKQLKTKKVLKIFESKIMNFFYIQ